MKFKIFTVYDSKAEAFLQPFFAPNRAMAIRLFQTAANTTDHDFNQHASDYTLFELGEFDNHDAKFVMNATPENLGLATVLVRQVEPDSWPHRPIKDSELSDPRQLSIAGTEDK